MAHRNLGELLVDFGIISPAELEEALRRQRTTGRRLGAELREMGLCSPEDVEWALSAQFHLPFVRLSPGLVDAGAARLVPPDLARDGLLVPTWLVGSTLHVVVADPTNRRILDRLAEATDRKVQLSVGLPSEIRRAIDEVYGAAVVGAPRSSSGQARWTSDIFSADEAVEINSDPGGGALVRALLGHADEVTARAVLVEPSEGSGRVRFAVDGGWSDVAHLRSDGLGDLLAWLVREAAVVPSGPMGFERGQIEIPAPGGGAPPRWEVRIGRSSAGRFALVRPARPAPPAIPDFGPALSVEMAAERARTATGLVVVDGPRGSALAGLGWLLSLQGSASLFLSVPRGDRPALDDRLPSGALALAASEPLSVAWTEARDLGIPALLLGNPAGENPSPFLEEARLRGLLLVTPLPARSTAEAAGRLSAAARPGTLVLRVVDVPLLCEGCREPIGEPVGGFRARGCGACRGLGETARLRLAELVPAANPAAGDLTARLEALWRAGRLATADFRELSGAGAPIPTSPAEEVN